MYICIPFGIPEAASQEDSFDMEKELMDVTKRVRDRTGVPVSWTPLAKSPDLKRSRQFSPEILEGPGALKAVAPGGAGATSSSAREMALEGLPQPVLAGTPCKGIMREEAPVPVKPPSPEKPAQLSPRDLLPDLLGAVNAASWLIEASTSSKHYFLQLDDRESSRGRYYPSCVDGWVMKFHVCPRSRGRYFGRPRAGRSRTLGCGAENRTCGADHRS